MVMLLLVLELQMKIISYSSTLTFNSRYMFVEKNVYFCDNENNPLGTETIHDVFKQNKTMSRDTGL